MRNLRQLNRRAGLATFLTALALFAIFIAVPRLHAADDDDFDSYKIRLDGFWFYSNPSGNIQGSGENGTIPHRSRGAD
jgi:hypothetical protein